jgi:hypothetical protein
VLCALPSPSTFKEPEVLPSESRAGETVGTGMKLSRSFLIPQNLGICKERLSSTNYMLLFLTLSPSSSRRNDSNKIISRYGADNNITKHLMLSRSSKGSPWEGGVRNGERGRDKRC